MNNEMNLTLFGNELPQEQEFEEFRYEVLDLEDREFVQEKEYEIRTHWTRAASEIMDSGEKLILVQDRLKRANKGLHGSFEGWLKKIGLDRANAFFSMKAYNRFIDRKSLNVETFSPGVLRELTYAPEEVIEQVLSGPDRPTVRSIQAAKKAQKKAEEEAEQAKKAAIKAKADADAARKQLTLKQASFQAEFDALTEQFEAKIKNEEKIEVNAVV